MQLGSFSEHTECAADAAEAAEAAVTEVDCIEKSPAFDAAMGKQVAMVAVLVVLMEIILQQRDTVRKQSWQRN